MGNKAINKYKYRILSLDANYIAEKGMNTKISKSYFKVYFDDSLDSRYLTDAKYKEDRIEFKEVFGDRYTTDIISVDFEYGRKYRKEFYTNGFVLNTKIEFASNIVFNLDNCKYVFYKRSAGSSRKDNCLFIKENLFDFINKWSLCGIKETDKYVMSNIIKFEAYKALSLSSIIDTIDIDPKSILIMKDVKSMFNEQEPCVVVKTGLNDKIVCEQNYPKITNNIFDGEGLLDESYFKDYPGKAMMLLRNRFFKCCVFNTKLKEWFEEHNNINISDIPGVIYTTAEKIDDIRLVITESSLKYLKFFDRANYSKAAEQWIKQISKKGERFGIVKTDKPTHYFEGNKVKTNYQFINTLSLSESDVTNLCSYTNEYLDGLKNNPEMIKAYFEEYNYRPYKESNNQYEDDLPAYREMKNIVSKQLLKRNPDFAKTKLFAEFRNKICNSIVQKANLGEILVNGTFATLFGNGYEFLLYSIGKLKCKYIIKTNGVEKEFDYITEDLKGKVIKDIIVNQNSTIDLNHVYCKSFSNREELTCARSPHITMGNLYMPTNEYLKEYDNWFNLSNEIVCVNAINENIQQRLNGCDYDSDFMLITNDKLINEASRRKYHKYVPYCGIEELDGEEETLSTKIEYLKFLSDKDDSMSDNYIGLVVDISQLFNSLYWEDGLNKQFENQKEDYSYACMLAVLSGIEIDKSKHNYPDNLAKTLISQVNDYLKDRGKDIYINKPIRGRTTIKKPMFLIYKDKDLVDILKKKNPNDDEKKIIEQIEKKYISLDTPVQYFSKYIICKDAKRISDPKRLTDLVLKVNKRNVSSDGAVRIISAIKEVESNVEKINSKGHFNGYSTIDEINNEIYSILLNKDTKTLLKNPNHISYAIELLDKESQDSKKDGKEIRNGKHIWLLLYLALKNNIFDDIFAKNEQ